MKRSNLFRLLIVPSFMLAAVGRSPAQDAPVQIAVHWDKIVQESNTTPTLQVVVNPPLRRGTAVHDNAFKALHDLQADYVRYVPWLPYPKLGVAELEPPSGGETLLGFLLILPSTVDFLGGVPART